MRYCMNCSRPLAEGSDKCLRCEAANEKIISGTTRALLIILSIFISPAGIVAGISYMAKDSREHRAFGKTMLIVSLVSITLLIICCCSSYVLIINSGFLTDAF